MQFKAFQEGKTHGELCLPLRGSCHLKSPIGKDRPQHHGLPKPESKFNQTPLNKVRDLALKYKYCIQEQLFM